MLHYVARTKSGAPLFETHAQANRLWRALVRLGVEELVLMPNHVHLLCEAEIDFGWAMSGYLRWPGAPRVRVGRTPRPLVDEDPVKVRRVRRYVHLNPLRAGLGGDPLAYAWSTLPDRLGLSLRPIVKPWNRRQELWDYVCLGADGAAELRPREGVLEDLERLVRAATRTPAGGEDLLYRRVLRAAHVTFDSRPKKEVAASLGISLATLRRARPLTREEEAALRMAHRLDCPVGPPQHSRRRRWMAPSRGG